MPKINKYQIVNFKYGMTGNRLLSDKIINLNGEHLQMEATNSVGKSMSIQTLIQAICPLSDVNKKFVDVYKSKEPIYTTIEWILDDNKTTLITGIGFEKKSILNLEEDVKDKKSYLYKFFTYTIEKCPTISGLECIEYYIKNNNINTLKSLNTMNTYIKEIKAKHPDKVFIFGQNSQAQAKYREKLAEYGIFQSEWKDILIKLNSGEAVLSNFFEEYNTTEKFIKNKVLPLIDNNLNKDANKVNPINQLREQVKKFIENCIKNEANIESYDDNLELLNYLTELKGKLEEIVDINVDNNKILDELSKIYYFSLNENSKIKQNLEELTDELSNLNDDLINVKFEEASYDLFKSMEKIKRIEEKIDLIDDDISNLKRKVDTKNEALDILKYQDLNMQLNKEIEDISKKEAYKETLALKNEELTLKLNNIGYSIKQLAILKDEELHLKLNDVSSEIANTKEKIKKLNEDKNNHINDAKYKEIDISKFELALTNYNNKLNSFSQKFEKIKSFMEQDLIETKINYNSYINSLEEELKEVYNNKELSENKSLDIETQTIDLNNNKFDKLNLLTKTQNEIEDINTKLSEINSFENNLSKIANVHGLDINDLIDNFSINKEINKLIDTINNEKNSLLKDKIKQEEELNNFKNLTNLYLDENLMSLLNQNNIEVSFGFNYIMEMETAIVNKIAFINKCPILPYSILISKKDFDKLKSIDINYKTKYSIPILIKEEIDDLKINKSNSIVSVDKADNIGLLMSFDLNLLDEKMRKESIDRLNTIILKIENESVFLDSQLDDIRKLQFSSDKLNYSKNNKLNLESKLDELLNNEETYNTDIKVIEKKIIKLKEEKKNNLNDIKNYEYKISNLNIELDKINELKSLFQSTSGLNEKINSLKKDVNNINRNITNITDDINNEYSKLNELNLCSNNLERDRKNNSSVIKNYNLYDKGLIIEGTIDELILKFDVLKKDNIISNIDDLNYDINNALVRKAKIEDELKEILNKLKIDDILDRVIMETQFDLKSEINRLNKSIKDLNIKKASQTKELNREEGVYENKLNNIEKKYKKKPIEIEQISRIDFKNRMNEIHSQIIKVTQEMEILKSNSSKLKQLINDLNKYKNNKAVIIDFNIDDLFNIVNELVSKLNESEAVKSKLFKECSKIRSNIEKFNISKNDKYKLLVDNLISDEININSQLETVNKVEVVINHNIDKVKNAKEHFETEKSIINKQLKNYLSNCINELKVLNKLGKVNGEVLFNIGIPDVDKINFLIVEDILNEIADSKDFDMINSTINSFYLLNRLINISNLKIKVVQYELNNKRVTVNWDKVIKSTSGGQRFCISFIILTILMEYKRYNSKELTHKSTGKVLVMDNPFGETSEIEFLNMVFKLADRFKVQIISYTHITNASIRLQFNRIYRMTVEKTINNKELVVIEEEKGTAINEFVSTNNYIINGEIKNCNMFDLIE